MKKMMLAISHERIEKAIFLIRGQKVMLDRDLSKLYRVPAKALIQAVKRNLDRFPDDFMFQLDWREAQTSRSQFVTLKQGQNVKYRPYAFTEQGIAMLSSILRSKTAVHVNIQIMRTFTRLRQLLETHKDLRKKIEEMEKKYDHQFKVVFDAIRSMLNPPVPVQKPKGPIGFHP